MTYNKKKLEYNIDYVKKNYHRVLLTFNTKYEQEILDYIYSIPNKNAYIKSLIEADMKKKKPE